ncbi:MAG: hypothetical protein QXV32_02920 [Conexivisphaerales archaeon]
MHLLATLAFYIILPSSVVNPYLLELFLALLAVISFVMLYRRIKGWHVEFTPLSLLGKVSARKGSDMERVSISKKLSILAGVTFRDILLLRRAGAWCEEDIHTAGRGMLMWGFGLLVIVSFIGFILDPSMSSYAIQYPMKYLLAASKAIIALGATVLLLRRLLYRNRRISTDKHTWILQSVFLFIGISGLLADLASFGASLFLFEVFYLLYLSSFSAFLLYYPFSELAFLIWKGSLLTQESFEEQLKLAIKSGKSFGSSG